MSNNNNKQELTVDASKLINLYCQINNMTIGKRKKRWYEYLIKNNDDEDIEEYFSTLMSLTVDLIDSALKDKSGLAREIVPAYLETKSIKILLKL